MRTNKIELAIRAATAATLLAALLAGCAKPPPEPAPAPSPPAETLPPPDASPAAPAQPAPDAPPPTEPSAEPKATTALEPGIESMHSAKPSAKNSAKMSVGADLNYSFDGAVLANQPVTLHLAAVPRVAGATVKLSVQQAKGLQFSAGPVSLQKTSAASVYRQQLSLTKLASGPTDVQVLVIVETGEGSTFGYFSIPLDAQQR